jgi:hypothetical protein
MMSLQDMAGQFEQKAYRKADDCRRAFSAEGFVRRCAGK